MIQRNTLMRVHMLLAAFVLPVAIMFLVTGGLYTWGQKGSYVTETVELPLAQPIAGDEALLTGLVTQLLSDRGLQPPSGGAKIKKAGTSFLFEWTGADIDIELEPTADPFVAKLKIKDTTWYRHLVQLHKAKGGILFKYLAAFFAVSLLVILISGTLMAMQLPKYRGQALLAMAGGFAVLITAILLS
ncbi:MAG TPA: hypothetical protein VLB10_04445 [Gammaproteobacteria bacterium]|nr:hypothetical protein [Gammaproteobacteria bacterium]